MAFFCIFTMIYIDIKLLLLAYLDYVRHYFCFVLLKINNIHFLAFRGLVIIIFDQKNFFKNLKKITNSIINKMISKMSDKNISKIIYWFLL